ncbi:MAG: hypothetical protein FWE23_04670 [Chitinivibrionia bacterium]|nr:hypothetical protein [Chitinivibrionia bacterium]
MENKKDKTLIDFTKSAFKHGIKEDDILHALSSRIFSDIYEDYPEKFLVIGFDGSGNLLEIMYNVEKYEKIKVFHAMKCRKKYIKELNLNIWR